MEGDGRPTVRHLGQEALRERDLASIPACFLFFSLRLSFRLSLVSSRLAPLRRIFLEEGLIGPRRRCSLGPPSGLVGQWPSREASRPVALGSNERCRWVAAFVTDRDRFSDLARLDPGPTRSTLSCSCFRRRRRGISRVPARPALSRTAARSQEVFPPPLAFDVPRSTRNTMGDGRGGRSATPRIHHEFMKLRCGRGSPSVSACRFKAPGTHRTVHLAGDRSTPELQSGSSVDPPVARVEPAVHTASHAFTHRNCTRSQRHSSTYAVDLGWGRSSGRGLGLL